MSKKDYCCSNCSKVVAKLDTESGNQLRKGMTMLCESCFKTFKNYERMVASSMSSGSQDLSEMLGKMFGGKF